MYNHQYPVTVEREREREKERERERLGVVSLTHLAH